MVRERRGLCCVSPVVTRVSQKRESRAAVSRDLCQGGDLQVEAERREETCCRFWTLHARLGQSCSRGLWMSYEASVLTVRSL